MLLTITGTQINYYFICHRKLWLFSNGIQMEHTSELVAEGKLIHATSYPQRPEKFEEVEIDGIKIDFYDARNKVIHEIKKSTKMEKAHEWQLKYYISVFEKNGIEGVTGILEYPALRETMKVVLDNPGRERLKAVSAEITRIINDSVCPEKEKLNICKKCSYFDFCRINEELDTDQINSV